MYEVRSTYHQQDRAGGFAHGCLATLFNTKRSRAGQRLLAPVDGPCRDRKSADFKLPGLGFVALGYPRCPLVTLA